MTDAGQHEVWPLGGLPEWADNAHRRLHGTGLADLHVVRATPWSTVVRWQVNDHAVWGKAVCPGFAAECAVLPILAERSPQHVLAPMATEPSCGWLLLPDGGSTMQGNATVDSWAAALVGCASLQRSLADDTERLLDAGCPDLRPHAAVARLEEMMSEGHVPYHQWLIEAAAHTARLIDLELVPATVQHDDLRPDNVFVTGRVFDWGDASVAHPFASLLTALMPDRPDRPGSAKQKGEIRDAYLRSWQQSDLTGEHEPPLELLRTQADLACLLAPIGRIDTWLRAPAAALKLYPTAIDRWVDHMLTATWP